MHTLFRRGKKCYYRITKGNYDMSYEESVKKVEDIIGQLGSGELSLDKAVEAFKQGMNELESCRKALENAKMTVKDAGETDNE